MIIRNIDTVMQFEKVWILIENFGSLQWLFLTCRTPFYKQRLITEEQKFAETIKDYDEKAYDEE